MTCLIGYIFNDKVFLGADRKLSFNDNTKASIDSDVPKILTKDNIMIGFVGNCGIQNLAELLLPVIDIAKFTIKELVQKLCNILSLFKDEKSYSSIMISDGYDLYMVNTNGMLIDIRTNNNPFWIEGVGQDIACGVLHTSTEPDPKNKIRAALKAVSHFYPNTVGGDFDIFSN